MSNSTPWVGIDLHRRRSQIAMIGGGWGAFAPAPDPERPVDAAELLGSPEAAHEAVEATVGWACLAELLEEAGFEVHLAHPLRTRATAAARLKTDAVDAKTLAHLLRTGLLPEAYIAPPSCVICGDLLRHRATLVRLRSPVKYRVNAIMAKHGV